MERKLSSGPRQFRGKSVSREHTFILKYCMRAIAKAVEISRNTVKKF